MWRDVEPMEGEYRRAIADSKMSGPQRLSPTFTITARACASSQEWTPAGCTSLVGFLSWREPGPVRESTDAMLLIGGCSDDRDGYRRWG